MRSIGAVFEIAIAVVAVVVGCMALLPVDHRVKGVSDIRATPDGLAVDFMM